ncbi:MAG: 4Fe-4S cluster-binding domain-containing protein [bacterium]|nr:4Fe-4S cluster-binding domain-containing protein [bacterium]
MLDFSEQIPEFYRQLINWQDVDHCPLAKMLVASDKEQRIVAGENADPIGDHVNEVLPGLIHRYPHKVLLVLNQTCAGHCRFCFRRASDFTHQETKLDLAALAAYLKAHPEVDEFILSGGDPLLVETKKWQALKKVLLATSTIKTVRWHSRLPVFNPLALTPKRADDFFALSGKKIILVIHINHPQEISLAFTDLIKNLKKKFPELILKSQSVLLAGVNDTPTVLQQLCSRLKEIGIQPYRLYHLDQAPGISHFRVSVADGLALMQKLAQLLPSTSLPEYYLDLPVGRGKVPVASLQKTATPHQYLATNHLGEKVLYFDLTSKKVNVTLEEQN